jgi:hypothetical protein
MFQFIINKIRAFVIRKTVKHKLIDIVEVRTKEIGLTSVKTETDIRIQNSFILSIKVLSIQTDLLNRDGIKVGHLSYEHPIKIKSKSDAILTTNSEISIITSLFQVISSILSHPIRVQSVGVAQIQFLWWIFEIPVNDAFEIHPSKLKIIKEETPEERTSRLENEAKRKAERELKSEERKENRMERRAERKENILKRKYKENYIPKEIRHVQNPENNGIEKPQENIDSATSLEITLEEQFIRDIQKQTIASTIIPQIIPKEPMENIDNTAENNAE